MTAGESSAPLPGGAPRPRPPLLAVRSCLGLLLFVVGGLVALFVLAGRETPSAWRRRLEEAGETLVLEALREEVPDEQNAAPLWLEFERRCAAGDPGFLRSGELPAALRGPERELRLALHALCQGTATDRERERFAAGLELVRDDLEHLDALLARPRWSFDEPRRTWEPHSRSPVFGQVLVDTWAAQVMNLGTRGPQLDLAISWSCVRAVLAAEANASNEAVRSLRLARHLIDALRSETHAPELAARVWLELRFLDALEACLPALEPGEEAETLAQRLARCDLYADLAAALRSRRIEMLGWLEREKRSPVPVEGLRGWVHRLAFGLDVQAVASAYREYLEALDRSPADALAAGRAPRRAAWRREWLTPSLDSLVGSGLGEYPITVLFAIQMRNDLLRIALVDRIHGRAEALEQFQELRDPATLAPLLRASAADGSERLWSVGPDGIDDGGGGDDVAITLP